MAKFSGFTAVERPPTLSRRAYLQLQQAIRDGALKAGVMYSENELAEQLGMSRTPVREAVISLSREGLIEIASQRGFRLRELTADERSEIFDLRALLEPYVAAQLATTHTDEQVTQLANLIDEQQRLAVAPHNAQAFLDLDEQFHLLQAEHLGLERTRATMANLRGAMWLFGFEALSLPHRYKEVVNEHRAILSAIQSSDSDLAHQAAYDHVRRTAQAALHHEHGLST
ncbi:GntR family transcriptional regulator [Gordonia sp. NPDC057258]|uniref:GntR family transcriptional regulator n=1 Tax=Gordonia terrae TaxID=2055 RepID=A0A2I1R107_9ACTN|nr:GntR family transcriptional regulator [Gordonia terrae]PKZ62777.1 GntR family transcriptional regulator [Gordonia terrae]